MSIYSPGAASPFLPINSVYISKYPNGSTAQNRYSTTSPAQQKAIPATSSNLWLWGLGGAALLGALYAGRHWIMGKDQTKITEASPPDLPESASTRKTPSAHLAATAPVDEAPASAKIAHDANTLEVGAKGKPLEKIPSTSGSYINKISSTTWNLLKHRNTLTGAGLLVAGLVAKRYAPVAAPIVSEYASKASATILEKLPGREQAMQYVATTFEKIPGRNLGQQAFAQVSNMSRTVFETLFGKQGIKRLVPPLSLPASGSVVQKPLTLLNCDGDFGEVVNFMKEEGLASTSCQEMQGAFQKLGVDMTPERIQKFFEGNFKGIRGSLAKFHPDKYTKEPNAFRDLKAAIEDFKGIIDPEKLSGYAKDFAEIAKSWLQLETKH